VGGKLRAVTGNAPWPTPYRCELPFECTLGIEVGALMTKMKISTEIVGLRARQSVDKDVAHDDDAEARCTSGDALYD